MVIEKRKTAAGLTFEDQFWLFCSISVTPVSIVGRGFLFVNLGIFGLFLCVIGHTPVF